jgi:hypothetical protein
MVFVARHRERLRAIGTISERQPLISWGETAPIDVGIHFTAQADGKSESPFIHRSMPKTDAFM